MLRNFLNICLFFFVTSISSQSQAQDAAEPVRNVESIDVNGVDLKSGALTWQTEKVLIGAAEGSVFVTSAVKAQILSVRRK